VLDGLNEGVVVNEIRVDDEIAAQASVALDRMLAVV
jgi:quinolinate synthase